MTVNVTTDHGKIELDTAGSVNWLLRVVIPEFSSMICGVEESEAFACFPAFDVVDAQGRVPAWEHPNERFIQHLEVPLVGEVEADLSVTGWEHLAGELITYLRIAVRQVAEKTPEIEPHLLDSLRGLPGEEYLRVKKLVLESGLPVNLGPLIVALAEYCELTYPAGIPENYGPLISERWDYCLNLLHSGEQWVALNLLTMDDLAKLPESEERATPVEDTRAFADLRYGKSHYLYVDDELLNLRLVNNYQLLEDAKARTDEHREPLVAMAEQAIVELLFERRTRQRVEEIMEAVQKPNIR